MLIKNSFLKMTRALLVFVVLFVSSYASGIPWLAPRLDGRIVGGQDANIEDHPYQVALEKDGSYSCGASIISREWVLTAANCVTSFTSNVSIRSGSSTRGKGGYVHKVVEIVVHPDYDSMTSDFDYALIRIGDRFDIGQPGVQVVALADKETQSGETCTVSGWGTLVDVGGPLSTKLQSVEIPIVDRKVCEEQYEDYNIVTARMICAGFLDDRKGICRGDSGNPLVCNGRLVGLASWGRGCAFEDYVDVYANVAAQRVWIKSVCGI